MTFGANNVTYTYLPNRPLVGSLVFNNGLSNTLFTTKQYDGLSQLTNIYSTVNAQIVVGNAYGYNLAGQRTNCVQVDGSAWNYGYDFLGQVTNGTRRWSDGQGVAGQNFAYAYDDIGNRKWANRSGDQQNYTANLLNQYTQRTVPGALWVQGDAAVAAGVQVNGVAAGRHGAFYSLDLPVDNTTGAVYAAVAIAGTGTNGATVVTNTVNGHLFAPQTPEALAYDTDGNLISDGRWTYTWDAENRLITQTSVGTAVPAVRLTFTYDANSRRVRKQLYSWSTNTANWSLTADTFFTYDGWNLIREERRPDAYYRSINMDYAWGLDVSGTMQKAGGVGGLLGITKTLPTTNNLPPSVYYTAYDALGNVTTLVATNGTIAASYLYSPFGETLVAVGPMARDNPIRFSTRVQDDETGLIIYTFRPYSPTLGRWLGRDPSEEKGGINLYAAFFDNPLLYVDRNGGDNISTGGENGTGRASSPGFDQYPNSNPVSWPNNGWDVSHYYGYWGGPDYTGGFDRKSWNDLTPEQKKNAKNPKDAQDQCYKEHDQCYGWVRDNFSCKDCTDVKHDCRVRGFTSCDRKLSACQNKLIANKDASADWHAKVAAQYFASSKPGPDCP